MKQNLAKRFSEQKPGLGDTRAVESPSFPFEKLSQISRLESWRKEVFRPTSYIHKWWARRLGSAFRGILLSCVLPEGTDVIEAFYSNSRFPNVVVFDPFMGSGTTVGEALKLGMRSIGRDLNPVAYLIAKTAYTLDPGIAKSAMETFAEIEREIEPLVRKYYHTLLEDGTRADVLYYFWVKQVPCPGCGHSVDLFPSYIFAKHAYPSEHPEAVAVCPRCSGLVRTLYNAKEVSCSRCGLRFAPDSTPDRGASALCPRCGHRFKIVEATRDREEPPSHRIYAKLVRLPNGQKRYEGVNDYDIALYQEAHKQLLKEEDLYPISSIPPGHNTNQVLGYSYKYWHHMFNSRQLLVLGRLGKRIRTIEDPRLRELFVVLFSATLEFNNMFASYKGEGTGAVRPLFSHHVLKPEKTPLEANPWLSPSGSFPAIFKTRLSRAVEYGQNPFEIFPEEGERHKKIYGLSLPMWAECANSFQDFNAGKRLYLSCGDSAQTDIASGSVDLVVTDPPYFDNVHYSELADFFFVWQRHLLEGPVKGDTTTRSSAEVQSADPARFEKRLTEVWRECHRVLKREGVLAFTFHHSDPVGWSSLLRSLVRAGFVITAVQPVWGELSRAVPKSQAKEPILYDAVIVCRKREHLQDAPQSGGERWAEEDADQLVRLALMFAEEQIDRISKSGLPVGAGDKKAFTWAHLVRILSRTSLVETLDQRLAKAVEKMTKLFLDRAPTFRTPPPIP